MLGCQVWLDIGLQLVWGWFRLGALHEWRPQPRNWRGISMMFLWKRMRENAQVTWEFKYVWQMEEDKDWKNDPSVLRSQQDRKRSELDRERSFSLCIAVGFVQHFGTTPSMWNHASVWARLWPRLLSNIYLKKKIQSLTKLKLHTVRINICNTV